MAPAAAVAINKLRNFIMSSLKERKPVSGEAFPVSCPSFGHLSIGEKRADHLARSTRYRPGHDRELFLNASRSTLNSQPTSSIELARSIDVAKNCHLPPMMSS